MHSARQGTSRALRSLFSSVPRSAAAPAARRTAARATAAAAAASAAAPASFAVSNGPVRAFASISAVSSVAAAAAPRVAKLSAPTRVFSTTVAAAIPEAAIASSEAAAEAAPAPTTDRHCHLAYAPTPADQAVLTADAAVRSTRAALASLLAADRARFGGAQQKAAAAATAGARVLAAFRRALSARVDWSGEAAKEFFLRHERVLTAIWHNPALILTHTGGESKPPATPAGDHPAGAGAASGSGSDAAAPAGGVADKKDKKDDHQDKSPSASPAKKTGASLTDMEWKKILDDVGANFKAKSSSSSSSSSGAAGKSGSGSAAAGKDEAPKLNGEEADKDDTSPAPMPVWAKYAIGGVAAASVLSMLVTLARNMAMRNHSWVEFKSQFLDTGLVKQIHVYGSRVVADLQRGPGQPHSDYSFTTPSAEVLEMNLELARQEAGAAVADWIPVSYMPDANIGEFTSTLFSVAMIYFLFRMFSSVPSMLKGGGGPMGLMGSRTKAPFYLLTPKNAKTRFTDVAGVEEAKAEIMEFVDFLRNPAKYHKLGAKIPKGALLVGPPGTGKTLLAKAIAGEAGVPFLSIAGSDFSDMFVGVGGGRVRDLFKEARKVAPSIIFIDEIDAIGRQRGGKSSSNEERDATLIQLLVEMDGFKTTENVIVLAGTNRVDILDKALLRPGRFDRRIPVDAPDIKGRVDIFKVHLAKLALNHDIHDLAVRLSALTPGMVGADIANVCNEGALVAARTNKNAVDLVDFERAIDRVIGGMERPNHIMNARERKLVAYHEAGHAVVGWFLEFAEPLLKVTIVPRTGGALGFAQYLPNELTLMQTEQLVDNITMTLGGRAAEKIFFDKISTGASNDLEQAHRVAAGMVSVYGMSDKLHNFSFPRKDDSFYKPVSEATSEVIDSEIKAIIDKQYERALKLVTDKRAQIEALAEALLERETINHDGLVALLGPRPFSSDAYVNFINMQKQKLATLEHPSKGTAPEDDPGFRQSPVPEGAGGAAPVSATTSAVALDAAAATAAAATAATGPAAAPTSAGPAAAAATATAGADGEDANKPAK